MKFKVEFELEIDENKYKPEDIKEYIEYNIKIKNSHNYMNRLFRSKIRQFIKGKGEYTPLA